MITSTGNNMSYAKIWNPTGDITFQVRMDPLGAGKYDVWAVQDGYARKVTSNWFADRKDAEALFLSKTYSQWMEELQ
jgi:hypothetical protein